MVQAISLKITVIGTGYVGLTTGLSLAYLGHQVKCIDKNQGMIEKIKSGIATIYETGLQELLTETRNKVEFFSELSHAIDSDVFMIAVGTPCKRNGDTDMNYVETAAREIGELLPHGSNPVIINKSTVPIGSARRVKNVIQYTLEKRGAESDFIVASNPEFLREGVALHDTFYPDRIVVGADDVRAFNVLRQLYSPVLQQKFIPPRAVPRPQEYELPVFITTNPPSAELIKYAANSFLAMKVSFINEFAGLAERVGADILEVAQGIGLDKRIGSSFLSAGAGWGGSCFPKDTQSILYTGSLYGYELPLVEAAVKINNRQRRCIIEKLQSVLKVIRGNTIGILGLAFKPGTDDLRNSPSIEITCTLTDMGAHVKVYDPVAMENCKKTFPHMDVVYTDSVEELAAGCDALALITDWREFAYLDWASIGAHMKKRILVDGRNMLQREDIESMGFTYIGMGRA